MPLVKMPDGTVVQMPEPEQLTPEQKQKLSVILNPKKGDNPDRWKQVVSDLARPTLEWGGLGLGAVAGTPEAPGVGTLVGAGLGYAGGKQVANVLDQRLGLRQQQPLPQELGQAGMDVVKGAGYQAGGELIGPILGMAAKPVRAAARGVVKSLPGAAVTLNEMGIASARAIPGRFLPSAQEAGQIFQAANQTGALIPTSSLADEAGTMLDKNVGLAGRDPTLVGYLKRFTEKLAHRTGLPVEEFHREMKAVGSLVNQTEKSGKSAGEFKKLYSTYWDTLNKAAEDVGTMPDSQGARLLRDAINTSRTELVSDDLGRYIEKGITTPRGQAFDEINASAILKNIKNDKRLMKTMPPDVWKDVESTLRSLNKIPKLPLGEGVQGGSMRKLGALTLAGGLGAGGALAMGQAPSIGAIAGTTAYEGGSRLIAKALVTDTGRAFLKQLILSTNGKLSPQAMALLGAYVTKQGLQTTQPQEPQ